MDADNENRQLYFMLVESRANPETDPLIIWLNGGPGCSSMLGLYTENGPNWFRYDPSSVKERFTFEHNEYSWNTNANVMYID